MSKIATTTDSTIWRCDSCAAVAESVNAFTLPPGWWVAVIERRTTLAPEYGPKAGGKMKRGTIEVCSKDCLVDVIQYDNQHFVDYVDQDPR